MNDLENINLVEDIDETQTNSDSVKEIAIIGSGISGLVSAIRVLNKGYHVTIYEKNKYIGGAFHYSQMTDYDNHYLLVGSNDEIRKNLDEVISFDFLKIKEMDYYFHYQEEGQDFYYYQDLKKLELHLLTLSAIDERKIKEFIELVTSVDDIDYSFEPKKMTFFKDKSTKVFEKLFAKFGSFSIKSYFDGFQSSLLKHAFLNLMDSGQSVACLILQLGFFNAKKMVYVENKDEIMNHFVKKIEDLGGSFKLNQHIVKINPKGGKIELTNQSEEKIIVDYAIDAACVTNLFQERLIKKYYTSREKKFYENRDASKTTSFFILDYQMKDSYKKIENYGSFKINNKFRVGAKLNNSFTYHMSENKIVVFFNQDEDDYEFWKIISKNSNVYKKEQLKIANEVKKELEDVLELSELVLNGTLTPIEIEKEFAIHNGGIRGFYLSPSYLGLNISEEVYALPQVLLSSAWLMKPFEFYSSFIISKKMVQRLDQLMQND